VSSPPGGGEEAVVVNDEPVENQSFPPVVGADFVQETGGSFAGDLALGYKIERPTPLVLPCIALSIACKTGGVGRKTDNWGEQVSQSC
jgi:hypothetical protein